MFYVRAPVAAGMFYDLETERLKKQIDGCINHPLGPRKLAEQEIIAAVAPHAGYMYSGAVQAWTYSRMKKANYVIIGPNHSGFGSQFAIMKKGLWKTPLGSIAVDEDFANKITDACELVKQDVVPHQAEHSIEVQIPFLQHRFGNDFKFVPICILNDFPDDTFLKSCRVVGETLAKVIKGSREKWILIASSDFSHYIPQEQAMKIDKKLIDAITKLDEKLLFSRVQQLRASICGYGPIAIVIAAAKKLGAKKGKLLKYATSGDTTGDMEAVVGYASIVMS